MFSSTVMGHWLPAAAGDLAEGEGVVVIDPELPENRSVSVLEVEDGPTVVRLSPGRAAVLAESADEHTRRLSEEDADTFAALAAAAPENDLDEAFVELDHWLVFGTFVEGRLAAAASMFPWRGTRLADLGVITLPEFRGRGLARATVLAMAAEALEQGYEPQYRCQLDNAPSVALALASGFRRFGEWSVIDD